MIKKRFQIGVFGTAFNETLLTEDVLKKAYAIGSEIAKGGHIVITGATTGIPLAATKGAQSVGGITVGISPASTPEQHVTEYKKPLANDVIIYTGMGFSGRNVLNIKTCDACIFVAGELGTLNEFTIAFYESKVIGILEKTGYIADMIRGILQVVKTDHGATVIFHSDPSGLVNAVIEKVEGRQ